MIQTPAHKQTDPAKAPGQVIPAQLNSPGISAGSLADWERDVFCDSQLSILIDGQWSDFGTLQ